MKILQSISILCVLLMGSTVYVDAAKAGKKITKITIKNTPKGIRTATTKIKVLMKDDKFEEAQRWLTALEKQPRSKQEIATLKRKFAKAQADAQADEHAEKQATLAHAAQAELIRRTNVVTQAKDEEVERAKAETKALRKTLSEQDELGAELTEDMTQELEAAKLEVQAQEQALNEKDKQIKELETSFTGIDEEYARYKINSENYLNRAEEAEQQNKLSQRNCEAKLENLEAELGAIALWRMKKMEGNEDYSVRALLKIPIPDIKYRHSLEEWRKFKGDSRNLLRYEKPDEPVDEAFVDDDDDDDDDDDQPSDDQPPEDASVAGMERIEQ